MIMCFRLFALSTVRGVGANIGNGQDGLRGRRWLIYLFLHFAFHEFNSNRSERRQYFLP